MISIYGNKINSKAQRLVGNDVEPSGSKRLAPRTGDDIVCSHMKVWAAEKAAKVSRTLVNIKDGNQWGISCGAIFGVQKTVFNTVDYGVVGIYTAATTLATA